MSEDMVVDDGGGRQKIVRVNYPSNSKSSKDIPQKPIIEKVITGEVHQRKKPLRNQILHSVIAESSESVAQYLIMDVLLPAAKDMIIEAFTQGIQRLFYGDSRPRRSDGRTQYTNYSKVSRPAGYETRRDMSRQARANHDFNDIIIETRVEADDVLENLRDLIRDYQEAKLSDLYDLLGVEGGTFTDERWGWTDLRSARVRQVRGGYLLELPKTEPLD
jgi:hypothetical protein